MGKYDDIINLPHPTSPRHPRMSAESRAAQFAPFAALVGYEDAVEETARWTDRRLNIDEDVRAELDRKQQKLLTMLHEEPQVTVTFFVPDKCKEGGAYQTRTGILKRIDTVERTLVFSDKTSIPLDDITELKSDVLGDETQY